MSLRFCVVLFIVSSVAARSRSSKDMIEKFDPEEEAKVTKELQEIVKDLEIVEKLESQLDSGESTRESRGLLKKLSFLAGMKVGGIIHSSGTLAASNSLRIFGKVMNTALSVSYGTLDDFDDMPGLGERPVVEEHSHSEKTTKTEDVPEPPKSTVNPTTVADSIRQAFIKNHNNLVDRINHKFLRNGATLRSP